MFSLTPPSVSFNTVNALNHARCSSPQLYRAAVQGLNEREGAHHAFTTSLMVFEGLAEGWLSWASYCDSVYESSKDRTWLQHAVCCYLQVREDGKSACQGGAATTRGCQDPGDCVRVHHASAALVSLGAAVSK